MSVFTPHGLKIRFRIDYCFGLMSRLWPEITPYQVLRLVEGLEEIPKLFSLVTGLFCFGTGVRAIFVGIWTLVFTVFGASIPVRGLFLIPGLPTVATAFSRFSGVIVTYGVMACLGLWWSGWEETLAFFVARFVAHSFIWLKDGLAAKKINVLIGQPLTRSEIEFIQAYRLKADNLGIGVDLEVEDWELDAENWYEVFESYAEKCPQAAAMSLQDSS